MAHFRAILNQHGLTEQQWRVLRALLDESPLEPRQICETCQLLSASATGVLARMEELGLVRRERMAEDQRRVRVSITPKSRALARRILPLVDAQYRQLELALGRSCWSSSTARWMSCCSGWPRCLWTGRRPDRQPRRRPECSIAGARGPR